MAFSRVTLVGDCRRADVVLPSREPVGRLIPELMRLVEDRAESPPQLRLLLTSDGGVLDVETSLEQAAVPDGSVLRLVRAPEAPAAPVVHDIAEELGDDLDTRAWRWGPVPRRWTATACVVAALVIAGVLLSWALPLASGPAVLGLAAAGLCVAGMTAGTAARESLGTALLLGGGAVALVAVQAGANANGWPEWGRWAGWAIVAAALLVLSGLATPLGRGGLLGGLFAAVPAAVWTAGAAAGMPLPEVAAIVVVVLTVVLGLLPRLALAASGLASLDDRRAAGAAVARHDVRTALAAAHRGLVAATVVTGMAAAGAGWVLAWWPGPWTVPLAALLAFIVASRSRVFPLAAQVIGLQAGAVVLVAGLLVGWARQPGISAYGPGGVAAVLALVPLVVLAAEPSEHMRARLRRLTDRLEAAAVIAVLPVAIGVFGTYGRLLHVF